MFLASRCWFSIDSKLWCFGVEFVIGIGSVYVTDSDFTLDVEVRKNFGINLFDVETVVLLGVGKTSEIGMQWEFNLLQGLVLALLSVL